MQTTEASAIPSNTFLAQPDRLALKPITPREREIIRLISSGLRNKGVAAEADIAPNTVKVHLRRVFKKLGVSTRADAITVATQRGLLS